MITLNSTVVVTGTGIAGNVEENVIVLEPSSEMYYSLDYVGAFIWNLLQSPRLVTDICEAVRKEYAVESEECQRDVLELLKDMQSHLLIVEQNSG